jgi:hypothetical protein
MFPGVLPKRKNFFLFFSFTLRLFFSPGPDNLQLAGCIQQKMFLHAGSLKTL